MSKSYRNRAGKARFDRAADEFRCRHCRTFVGALPSGGRHRNHCPRCLYSRHVDGRRPGDRASECGASMRPVGAFLRERGEHVILHRCDGCGFERHNRIAADDDFVLVLRLPLIEPRTAGRRQRDDAGWAESA